MNIINLVKKLNRDLELNINNKAQIIVGRKDIMVYGVDDTDNKKFKSFEEEKAVKYALTLI